MLQVNNKILNFYIHSCQKSSKFIVLSCFNNLAHSPKIIFYILRTFLYEENYTMLEAI